MIKTMSGLNALIIAARAHKSARSMKYKPRLLSAKSAFRSALLSKALNKAGPGGAVASSFWNHGASALSLSSLRANGLMSNVV